jgi:hypothetical protein
MCTSRCAARTTTPLAFDSSMDIYTQRVTLSESDNERSQEASSPGEEEPVEFRVGEGRPAQHPRGVGILRHPGERERPHARSR